MHVVAGTDTYGRVKSVCGTPIVTKFAMLQILPIYPLQSFYFVGWGPTKTLGIPCLAGTESGTFHGIPLASVDAVSVVMAYVRGVCGFLAIVGVMPGMAFLVGGPPGDKNGELAMYVILALGATGVVAGLLTYAIPLVSHRERSIRRYCAEILVVAADPARVRYDMSAILAEYAQSYQGENNPRMEWIRQLITIRATIAQSTEHSDLEVKTDELLENLENSDRNTA
jgi:hypothetical protein